MLPCIQAISELLGSLYQAAAAPDHWPEFFNAVQRITRADTAYFILVDPENRCNFSLNYGFDPKWQEAYAEYFNQQDPIYARIITQKQLHGEWASTRQALIPDDEYRRMPFYHEFQKPQGLYHQCAIALGGLEDGLEGGLGLQRAIGAESFGEDTVALLSMLAPHLRSALNTHRMISVLRNENAELREGIEALDLAFLSLDGKGRVLRFTAMAGAILDARDGLKLEDGCLRAILSTEQARLEEMIAGAAATGCGQGEKFAVRRDTRTAPQARGPLWTPHAGGAMLISRKPPKRSLQIVITPFYSGEILLDEQPAALVFVSDPDAKPASRSAVLRALYGLTPTECRIADYLADGHELASAADQMRITIETARFHLKTIFRKTRTSRQPDLVRLVLGLPGIR
jgi:DNA-binding CsgD family transcriptional regulator